MNYYSNENSKESEEINHHKNKFIKQVQAENVSSMENYFHYGNFVLLIYVWKYLKKFEKIHKFMNSYYDNISLVSNVGSVLGYFFPKSEYVSEKIKQASNFENMTVMNLAIINNSKSTNFLYEYISSKSDKKIDYQKVFSQLFMIQTENHFNQYISLGLLICCIISIFFLNKKSSFKLLTFLYILLLNAITSYLRIIFICLGGVLSLDLYEDEPIKIFVGLLIGCIAGIILTVKANNYFIAKIMLDNFDVMGECSSRARQILNVGRSCSLTELELKSVESLQNVFDNNYMARISHQSMILGAFAIIRDKIKK